MLRKSPGATVVIAATTIVLLMAAPVEVLRPTTSTQALIPAQNVQPARLSPASLALLDQYCVSCHNERLKTADLVLSNLERGDIASHAEVLEKVRAKLRSGSMPPNGLPRPTSEAAESFIASLEGAIDDAARAHPNPGRPAIHRLNRSEYANAVRDLFALEIDARALLPGDDSGYGFDNIADVLTVSPGLLERYILAAKKIARLAIGDSTLPPGTTTYKIPYMTLIQDDRMSEDLPFGSRGGMSFSHYFPLDGEYVIRVRLQRNELNIGYRIRGLDVENAIDVRIDGARVKLFSMDIRDYKAAAAVGYGQTEDKGDDGLDVRVPVKAGLHTVGIAMNSATWYVEGVGPSHLQPTSAGYSAGLMTDEQYGKTLMGIDHVDVVGPFGGQTPRQSPSRERLFTCRPAGASDEEKCATEILSTIARLAYRRPLADSEILELLTFHKAGRAKGDFDQGIQAGLERILVSPHFLFRIEARPAALAQSDVYQLGDFELASRLSFFLWSSIPDEQLLDVAAAGKLRDPDVWEGQVRRMLADPRSAALVHNFFGQWLYVRNMSTHAPDPKIFQEFDESLRRAFQQETEMFLESQLREDRSVVELLTANYTFVNERLARHYGIPNVFGSHFRRVTLPDRRRAGILGQGTILTVTSYANRTSPVVRGKWLLENLLGTPPPPPPNDVPALEEGEAAATATMRERMEAHRKNPVCAACHAKMDPLGFALENFDGIGGWRMAEGNVPIDPSGTFPDGESFSNPSDFRTVLLHHQAEYLETLTGKLLTYALGRGTEYYDMPAIRSIVRESAANDHRWSSIVLQITRSTPFQMRKVGS